MLALRVLGIVLPIFLIVFIGALYGRYRRPEMEAANRANIEIFIPALVFASLSRQSFELMAYLPLATAGGIVLLGSGGLAWLTARYFHIAPRTLVPPLMFRNAGNMGLPLFTLAFGDQALPAALVLFLLGNLAHFGLGPYLLDRQAHPLWIFRQPVILAALAALLVSGLGIVIPAPIALPVEMLGQVSIPLMLFALGVRLVSVEIGHWRVGLIGACTAPVFGILITAFLLLFFELPDLQRGMLILFGVLPPAVLNFLFAEHYQQEPARVASIVVLGNLLTVVTLPLTLVFVLARYT